jgi:hypothetical protein
MNKCDDCKYAVIEDYGYSNYTVEGTTVSCGKRVFEPFDNFYGEAPEYKQEAILNCTQHAPGGPIYMDVDGETTLTPEEQEIYDSVQ